MSKRDDVSVKMDARVVDECRIAAAFRALTLAEYLSESMRQNARRDIEDGYAQRSRGEVAAPPPHPEATADTTPAPKPKRARK